MGKGRGGCRVSQVVGGNVDRLHRGDGALLRGGDALLQRTHFRCQSGLIADGGGHTAQQRRDLRACLGETEDIVDEQQHVLPLAVTEVLRHGQT